MRHRVAGRKLGRTTEHRVAMLRNMTTSLLDKEKIRTTLIKAKELRPFAERLITISKQDSLHARRRVLRHIHEKSVVQKLFDTLGPRYSERPGGYTRIIKLGPRRGDNAEMAIVELVDAATEPSVSEKPEGKKAADDGGADEAEAKSKKKATKRTTAKTSKKKTAAAAKSGGKTTKKKAAKKKTSKVSKKTSTKE